MAKHAWSVICERSIIDSDAKTISLMNVLEEVHIVAYVEPGLSMKIDEAAVRSGNSGAGFNLVSLWLRDDVGRPEKGRGRVELLSPSGKVMLQHEYDVDLSQYLRLRTKVGFPSAPLDGPDPKTNGPIPGIYIFKTQQQKKRGNKKQWVTESEQYLTITITTNATYSNALVEPASATARSKRSAPASSRSKKKP